MKKIIIVATILWALNFKIFLSLFDFYTSSYEALYEIVAYYVMTLFFVTLFSFSKFLNLLFVNFLFVVSIFGVYFINTMGIVIDGNMLNNILSTDSGEAFELMNSTFYIYTFLAFSVLYSVNKYLLLKQKRLKLKQYASAIALILIVALGLFKLNRPSLDKFISADTPTIAPIFLVPSISEYIILRNRLVDINKKNISAEYKLDSDSNDTVVVFILGESARGDRFGLNAYSKNTTPKLSQLENLISYSDTTSCHTSTLNSVPCLMTRVLRKDYDITIKETSFIQVFRDLGYNTYWFSVQSPQKRVDTFCQEAQICEYIPGTNFDGALLDKLNVLEEKEGDSLVVLHTLGSHFDYNEREPDTFKIYQPLCLGNVSSCTKEELDNSYDNSIVYTDEFISQVIERLKNKNACLVYTSDHGESLGEGTLLQRYGHSTPYAIAPKEQKDVPLIVWFSDTYLQTHPDINLSKMRAIQGTSHDNVFETLLGCGNIVAKNKNGETLNLLRR